MKRQQPSLLLPILLGIIAATAFLYANSGAPSGTTALVTLSTATPAQLAALLPTPAAVSTTAPEPRAQMLLPNAGVVAPIIDVYIRDGAWDVENLGAAVGHLQGTAPLGANSNIGLAGHSELRDGTRGIFAYIRQLNYGDPIIIERDGERFEYRVSSLRHVDPSDLSVLSPTDTERLTLITCDDYDFINNLYRTRVVVTALRVS